MKIWLIISIVCFVYFLFLLSRNMGTKFFYIWLVLAAGFFMIYKIEVLGSLMLLPKTFLYIIRCLIIIGGIILGLACITALRGFFFQDPGEDPDYVIVLGAQVKEDGPSRVLRFRIERAAEFLKLHPAVRVIVSGGKGKDEPDSEASVMKQYLIQYGISEERIIMEDRSKNTEENFLFSSEFFDKEHDQIAVITSNFHVYRSISLTKKLGYKNVYGIPAKTTPIYLPHNLLRESLSVIKAVLEGNL